MIASVHIADVGVRSTLDLRRRQSALLEGIPGMYDAELALGGALKGSPLPSVDPARVVLIATWRQERALERFLAGHPLAERLSGGWHVRLEQTRVSGSWSQLASLVGEERRPAADEPVAVLTLGRVKPRSMLRFFRMSAAAEALALRSPTLLAGTTVGRAPNVIGTFTLWRDTAAMRDYAVGRGDPAHLDVIRANSSRPFFREAVFARFRPYGAEGSWEGREPLAAVAAASAPG